MGATNVGNQVIVNPYNFALNANLLNGYLRIFQRQGVSDGLTGAKQSDSLVRISAGSLVVRANNDDYVAVGAFVRDTFDLSVSSTYKRVIARYTWTPTNAWYVDFVAIDPLTTLATDCIIFDCVYSGSIMTGISYSATQYLLSVATSLDTAFNQSVTGDIDGMNTVYDTPDVFVAGTTCVYLNGLRQQLVTDYTETGVDEITFATPPLTGDVIVVDYVKA